MRRPRFGFRFSFFPFSAREGGDVRNFWLELTVTIENVRKVSLVWADVPNPLQSPGGPLLPDLDLRAGHKNATHRQHSHVGDGR